MYKLYLDLYYANWLGLKRLEERWIRADLLFAYKLLFGFTPINVHEFFTPSKFTGTRGHAYKLF